MMWQTSAYVPALQKLPPGAAKGAAAGSATKGKGGKQKPAEEGGAAKSLPAAPKRGRRAVSKPAAGMISQLSRRLLHMRIMLCELFACPTCAPPSSAFCTASVA